MIDYGALVFKNGKLINEGQFFMDMEASVGWVDVPNIRYDDCDCFYDDEGKKCSDCANCLRAQKTGEETYYRVVADCKGVPIRPSNDINGNFFAYIGNKKLTLAFYKTVCNVYVDGMKVAELWGTRDDNGERHKVLRQKYGDIEAVIRSIAPCINVLSVKIDGDSYHVIYGYGIDSDLGVWNEQKVHYVGKTAAKNVDKLINRYWRDRS